jgi:hypothetical protein
MWLGCSAASPGESKKNFSARLFPILPSLDKAALPPIFMQHLAQDAAEVAELREEVTGA